MAFVPYAPQPNHRGQELRVILPPRCYEKARKYELTFSENLTDAEAELVRAYWAMKNGGFTHKADALASANSLTVPGLTALARAGTTCRVSLGYCLGGDEVLETLATRSAFTACLHNFYPPHCPECQDVYMKRQKFEANLTANAAVN